MEEIFPIQNDDATVRGFTKKDEKVKTYERNENGSLSFGGNRMHTFRELSSAFEKQFANAHFPN